MNFAHITPLLSQLPVPAPGDLERWAFSAASIATLVVLGKKLFTRNKTAASGDFVTRAEFQHELSALRDKIDARFLALSEKIETLGNTLLNPVGLSDGIYAKGTGLAGEGFGM